MVDTVDRERIAFVKHYFNADWPTRSLYHVMIKPRVGNEAVIETILHTMRLIEGHPKATDYESRPKVSTLIQPGVSWSLAGCAGRCGAGQQFSAQTSGRAPSDPSARRSALGSIRSRISSRIMPINFGCTPTVFARVIGKPSESQSCRASISRSYSTSM